MGLLQNIRWNLREKSMRHVIEKVTKLVYSEMFDLDKIVKSFPDSFKKKMEVYVAIKYVSKNKFEFEECEDDIIIRESKELNKLNIGDATDDYYSILSKEHNENIFKLELEVSQLRAKEILILAESYFFTGKKLFEKNKYSYHGARYNLENIQKGPLTFDQHQKLKHLANEMDKVETKIQNHLSNK